MSRNHTRISRTLIAILAITIVLGVVFYAHNLSKTKATESTAVAKATPEQTPPVLPARADSRRGAPPRPRHPRFS